MREDFQLGGRGNCPLWIRYRGEEASTDIKRATIGKLYPVMV